MLVFKYIYLFLAINNNVKISHPHTIFVHYNRTEVKNIYEEEVTEAQIFGRALLKAFTVAASYARQRYGVKCKLYFILNKILITFFLE